MLCKCLRFAFVLFFSFILSEAQAQDDKDIPIIPPNSLNNADTSQARSDSANKIDCGNYTKPKDVIDVLESLGLHFHYGAHEDTAKGKTGRVHISAFPGVGYTLTTKFAVAIGANAAFYTDESPDANLSVIIMNPVYTQQHQFILPLQSNIWSKGNKYDFVGDWRYFKYPELTYGLGGHTTLSNPDSLNYSYLLFRETVLRSIAPDLLAGIGFAYDYHWNITESGLGNGVITDYESYSNGKATQSRSSGITFNLLYDKRRNVINPPKGFYADVILRANSTALGSDGNWQSLLIDMRKYFKLSACSNNVLAFWSYTWLTLGGKPPYLDLPSTGWDAFNNLGRGYIQSRLKSNNLLYLESEYRFGISRNGFLGGVVFANAQSVSEITSGNFDVILPAIGAGIRIKLNKHSNTNLALDYGIGTGGSNGVFVNLGEVF